MSAIGVTLYTHMNLANRVESVYGGFSYCLGPLIAFWWWANIGRKPNSSKRLFNFALIIVGEQICQAGLRHARIIPFCRNNSVICFLRQYNHFSFICWMCFLFGSISWLPGPARRSIKPLTMTDVVADAVNRGYENVVDFFTRNEGNWLFFYNSYTYTIFQ